MEYVTACVYSVVSFCHSITPSSLCRCVSFLREADGGVQCVDACPSGFSIAVIPNTTISVRTCEGMFIVELVSFPGHLVMV